MTVSTSAKLLASLQLDDFIYGVVGQQAADVEEEDNGVQLWNIPGMGVLGVGAATAAIIGIYVANPGMKEDLETVVDLFGDKDRDEKLDKAADLLGEKGEETNPRAPTKDGEPRIAAEPLSIPSPKAEAAPEPEEASVSRGYQMQGSGMPLPTGPLARPSAQINQVLQNTAKTEGVDYRTLYALGGAESSFSAGATAKKSSATGLFQFTTPTWTYLTQKVYPELGYKAGDRTDPQKSAVVAARYIKSIQASLQKKLGKAPTIGETYLGYFMGPSGASNFLDALKKNPNAKGADVFPKAAAANPNLFYHKGDKSKPLALSETMARLEGKVVAYYEQAGVTQVARAEPAAPTVNSPQAIPVNAYIPAVAVPKPLAVPAPDFNALKGGAKGEARDVSMPIRSKPGTMPGEEQVASTGGSESPSEVTYVRDKHGRLISIRGM